MGSRKAVAPKRNQKAGKTSMDGAKVKRKYRRSADVKARWEIIKQKRKVTPEYTHAAVNRLVREVAREQDMLERDLRFEAKTIQVFEEIAMNFTVDFMMTGADAMAHAGRVTIQPKDLYVDKEFREFAHVIYNRMESADYDGPMTCYIPRGMPLDETIEAMRRRFLHKQKRGLLTKKEYEAGLPERINYARRVVRSKPKKTAKAASKAEAEPEPPQEEEPEQSQSSGEEEEEE